MRSAANYLTKQAVVIPSLIGGGSAYLHQNDEQKSQIKLLLRGALYGNVGGAIGGLAGGAAGAAGGGLLGAGAAGIDHVRKGGFGRIPGGRNLLGRGRVMRSLGGSVGLGALMGALLGGSVGVTGGGLYGSYRGGRLAAEHENEAAKGADKE